MMMLVCIGISFSSFFQKILKKVSIFFLGSYLWLAAELQNTKNWNPRMGIHHSIKPSMGFNEEKHSLSNVGLKSQNPELSDAHFGFWMNRHFLAIVAKKHFCTKKAVFRNRTNVFQTNNFFLFFQKRPKFYCQQIEKLFQWYCSSKSMQSSLCTVTSYL